jgi:hypothetical protein
MNEKINSLSLLGASLCKIVFIFVLSFIVLLVLYFAVGVPFC